MSPAVRIGALYLPILLAFAGWGWNPRRPRQFASILLSLLWTLPALLALQRVNQLAGWWSFAPSTPAMRGMPVELYLGWVILWGAVPQLAFPRFGLALQTAIMVTLDLLAMPLCHPAVITGPHWLVGEAFAAALVLFPSLAMARWTEKGRHLNLRAAGQVATSGILFLYFLPEFAFALKPGLGWGPLLSLNPWQRQSALLAVFTLALPGVGAVMEFAKRGHGTPIPYDPPQRLVVAGIYRYVANPMQISCAAVMLVWALLLRNPWFAVAAVLSVVYSAGLAESDERDDLTARFGAAFAAYREQVKSWRLRLRPWHTGPPALLYFDVVCEPCSEVQAFLQARHPVGLEFHTAQELSAQSIRRLRYIAVGASGEVEETVEGIRAMGRALEHLHIGWAMVGILLRLPGLASLLQLVMDAAGFGPREPVRIECG